jgi:hypothetical protein
MTWVARIADAVRETEAHQRASSGGDKIIQALDDDRSSAVMRS